jgi:polyisoprenoid-binding protein YceI
VKTFLALCFFFSFPYFLYAAPQVYEFSGQNGKKQIVFYSKATVEDFDGTASEVTGTLSVDFSKSNLALSGAIGIPVSSMNTGMSMRDTHMMSRDWLDAETYPSIQFVLSLAVAQKVISKKDGEWQVEAVGDFKLKGRSKKMTVPTTIKKKGEDVLVSGEFVVPLREFGIYGPTAMKMLGLRVANDVRVVFKLVGKSGPGWPASHRK